MQKAAAKKTAGQAILTSVDWIKHFNTALLATRCRIGKRTVPLQEGLDAVAELLAATREADNSLWWVGNGGSAGLCAHLSQDALNKLKVRSLVLADAPLLTCMANDFGYAEVYERPLRTLTRAGDMLIGVSSSGNSENILRCARMARERGMKLVTLSAFGEDNALWRSEADVAFHVPTRLYGHAEVGHEALLHSVLETMMLREQTWR